MPKVVDEGECASVRADEMLMIGWRTIHDGAIPLPELAEIARSYPGIFTFHC